MKTLMIRSLAIPAALLLATGAQAGDAQAQRTAKLQLSYRITALPSLGGTSSVGNSINDRGWVAGRSNLPSGVRHAALWRNGAVTDLGSLGGPGRNSSVLWPVKNLRGIVTGITQTAEPDPLNEKWSCGFFFPAATGTGFKCVGFKWQNGVMTPLPTLGGTHGFATGSNNFGMTVGWAENQVEDSTCVLPQRLQFRAVIWGPNNSVLRQLPPLPGDTTTAATAINDRGQVVGISGICDQAAGRFSAIHNVLWEHGQPRNIGDLGGVAWNTPMMINQRGDIVGFANASAADGGDFNPRAYVKLVGNPLRKIDPLPGDASGQGLGINEWRQVVGQSCDAEGNCRAFLWHNGVSHDLNALAPDNDDLLTTANDIDDFGRITGQGFDDESGQFFAYIATPVWK